jgi:hypothetical protein
MKGVAMNLIFAAEPDCSSGFIRFYYLLNQPESIQFEILDLKGKRVARISKGVVPAGIHTVLWSTSHLPDGVYLFRFSIRKESIVQKVTLSA